VSHSEEEEAIEIIEALVEMLGLTMLILVVKVEHKLKKEELETKSERSKLIKTRLKEG
jgi:hypothetical protein